MRAKDKRPAVPIWVCPECLTKQVRYSTRFKRFTCIRCGNVWSKEPDGSQAGKPSTKGSMP